MISSPVSAPKQDWLDKFLGFTHGSPKVKANTGYLLFRLIYSMIIVHSGVIFAGILVFEALSIAHCGTGGNDDGATCGGTDDGADDNSANCVKLWGFIKPDSLLTAISSAAGLITAILCPFAGTAMDFTPYRKDVGMYSIAICFFGTLLCVSLIIPTEFTLFLCSFGFFLVYIFKDGVSMTCDCYVPELSQDPYEIAAATSGGAIWLFIGEISQILFFVIVSYIVPTNIYGTVVTVISCLMMATLARIAYHRLPPVVPSRHIPEGQTLITFSAVRLRELTGEVIEQFPDLGYLFFANMIFDPALQAIFVAAILIMVSKYKFTASQVTIVLFVAIIGAIPGAMSAKWAVHTPVFDTCYPGAAAAAALRKAALESSCISTTSVTVSERICGAGTGADVGAGAGVGVCQSDEVGDTVMDDGNANADYVAAAAVLEAKERAAAALEHELDTKVETVVKMKVALIAGLLAATVTTILATFAMSQCQFYLGMCFGFMWGFSLSWCWNSSNMLRNALVPGGSEAEFSGLIFSSINLFAWLPTMIFTIANEAGSINVASLSLNAFFIVGVVIVYQMDIKRGLAAREFTLHQRRWVHHHTHADTMTDNPVARSVNPATHMCQANDDFKDKGIELSAVVVV